MFYIVPYQEQHESSVREQLIFFQAEVDYKLGFSALKESRDDGDDITEVITDEAEDALARIKDGSDDCYLALDDEGKVVGFQITHHYDNAADKHIRQGDLELSRLYVHPDFRGRGVAKKLDEHCLRAARDAVGIQRVITFIEAGTPNVGLKIQTGFKKYGQYQDGSRVYHAFRKDIC